MDAFVLSRVVSELSAELPGALVSKVSQPHEREIVLTLWTGREEKRLLVSADAEMCRLHLTTRKDPNPPIPPRFCTFLRRHLEGMRVAAVSATPFDRSVRIDFRASRPDALHERTTLHAELYGRHANLIYVDGDGTILEPLRAVPAEESRVREVLPGLSYRPLPRPARIFLPDATPADAARIFAGAWEGLDRAILREIPGVGRELAREAAVRGKESPAALYEAFRALVRLYGAPDEPPGIGTLPSGKTRLLPFPCPGAGFVSFSPFPAANAAADAYYGETSAARHLAALRQQVRSKISALLRKERHTAENVAGDLERAEEGLKGKDAGETLKANLPGLRRGMEEFRGIPLDPAKTPVENMERYFRLFRKAKRAMEAVRNRKRAVAESVFYLESLEAQIERAATREEVQNVRQELSAAYPGKKPPAGKTRTQRDAPRPAAPQVERRDVGGFVVYVGRNNVGNDRIVKELAAPDDLWLHAQGIPGSHVLVKRPPGTDVPAAVLEEAARLAVENSRAKGASNVPVFLAEARHVSKFKGARPGLVRIAKYTTVNVR